MTGYLIIWKIPGGYKIRAEYDTECDDGITRTAKSYKPMRYYGYSRREAISHYRAENGLQRRHLTRIEI